MERIVILGGSFNPVHNGHLRLALEVGEAIAADRVDFVPSFRPPHKQEKDILPFELRVKMLELALQDYTGIETNQFESNSAEPSYSYYTLKDYCQRMPKAELFFVLGLADFAQLSSWHKWEELIELTNFIVVPRGDANLKEFLSISRTLWPNSKRFNANLPLVCLSPENTGKAKKIIFLPVPRLDISSSLIRKKWQENKRLDFLVPQNVLSFLQNHTEDVNKNWAFFDTLTPDNCEPRVIHL